jgi:uncharacterized integral membrane protein
MLLGVALMIFVAVFALQNVATVELTFLLWSFSLPRAIMVLVVLAVGFIVGWLLRSLRP